MNSTVHSSRSRSCLGRLGRSGLLCLLLAFAGALAPLSAAETLPRPAVVGEAPAQLPADNRIETVQ